MDAETKICPKCGGEPKPATEFHRDNSKRDGLAHSCKSCKSAYLKAYRAENLDELRSKELAYREANRESARVRARSWYKSNTERALAANKAWVKANAEKNTAFKRKHKAKSIAELSDSYVREVLAVNGPKIKYADIPQSLIDLKRVQVQITRKLKEFKKCK